jgi:uncharacterized protein YidB (DUF937 family)
MGLLDSVIGNVAGNLLGGGAQGGQGQMVQVLLSMLSQGGGQSGGLGDLLGKFSQAGLGDVASSWVGTGANLPISAEQLTNVLGSDTLGALAGQLGMDQGAATSQLSELLPGVIDALTPNGQMPSGGADLGGLASQVLGQFLKR